MQTNTFKSGTLSPAQYTNIGEQLESTIIADIAEYAAKYGIRFSDAKFIYEACGHKRIIRQITVVPAFH
jgi:hypothetical protein